MLLWLEVTPQPWMEQKLAHEHLPLMAALSWATRQSVLTLEGCQGLEAVMPLGGGQIGDGDVHQDKVLENCLFIGHSKSHAVKMALKLFSERRNEGFGGYRGHREVAMGCGDAMNGCSRVCTAKGVIEVASGLLLLLNHELQDMSPGFPHSPCLAGCQFLPSQSGQGSGKLPAASSKDEAISASKALVK